MAEYFEIKKFDECSVLEWNKFCFNSDDCWLWHTSYGIISKTFWNKHFNLSFSVIDKSDKKSVVAIVPLFLIKRKKIIDYSILDSLGGPALSPSINEKKKKKLTFFINNYLLNLLKTYKINKCEFISSTLSNSIIRKNTIIPNPLGPFINKEKSSFTWIKNLTKNTKKQIFDSFDKKAQNIIKKGKKHLYFNEVKEKENNDFLSIYFNLHLQTTSRKGINNQNLKYFEYIFLKVPKENKKIFYVKKNDKILTVSIFALYKNNAAYWTNVSDLKGLQFGANYFCMWKAIEYFKKINIQFIDFGEGFFTHENKDKFFLNHFKKSFGGIKYPLFRGDKVLSNKWDYFYQFLREIKNFKN